jgi:hypothetical protein
MLNYAHTHNTRSRMSPQRGPCVTASIPDDFDISDYLQQIQLTETNVDRSDDEKVAITALDITKAHYTRGSNVENSFLNGIAAVCKFLHIENVILQHNFTRMK